MDVNFVKIRDLILKPKKSKIDLEDFKILKNENKVSIEVYFHAILGKIVFHTHPTKLNSILCSTNAKLIIKKYFKSKNFIEYVKPGYELGIEIYKALQKEHQKSNIVFFLQNHGLIISGDNVNEIIKKSEEIENISEAYLKSMKQDLNIFKVPEILKIKQKIFKCTNPEVYKLIKKNLWIINQTATNPDTAVFCGPKIFIVNSNTFLDEIKIYSLNYNTFPKIYFYKNDLFFLSQNYKSSEVIEEILLSHLRILSKVGSGLKSLSKNELKDLFIRNDEKYRLNLITK